MTSAGAYTVVARNLSRTSENKIHDDDVARRFGFTGALVPGVEVFAYACAPPLRAFGRSWLSGGGMALRFLSPVYDGATVAVTATPDAAPALGIAVTSGERTCASGRAWVRQSPQERATVPDAVAPPAKSDRPPASDASLAVGRVLCTALAAVTPDAYADYLDGISAAETLFRHDDVLHPGWLLRRCNSVLVENVVLPPWIHTASWVELLGEGRVGETIEARGIIRDNGDRNGHTVVELDIVVLGNGARPLARVAHTAIWRLRGTA